MIRGRVEFRIDPLGLGNVRIRVPGIHDENIPTEELPWASYVSPLGGGLDSGAFCVPEVGAWVACEKEQNSDEWLYFGVVRGTGAPDTRGAFIKDDRQLHDTWLNLGGAKVSDTEYQEGEMEVPRESTCLDKDPSVSTVYKSIKGATIVVSDTHGDEYMDIISHSGSTIRMISPRLHNEKNRSDARLAKNKDNPIELDTVEGNAFFYKSTTGSIIRLIETTDGVEFDLITNDSKDIKKRVGITIDPTLGTMKFFTEDSESKMDILIDKKNLTIKNKKANIQLLDDKLDMDISGDVNLRVGGKMNIEANGDIVLRSNTSITREAPDVKDHASSIESLAPSVKIGSGTVTLGPTVKNGEAVPSPPAMKASAEPALLKSEVLYKNDKHVKFGGDKPTESS